MQTNQNPVRKAESYNEMSHVQLNDSAIEDLAETLAEKEMEVPAWDAPVFPDEDASTADVVDFLMIGNSINFAFNDPDTGEKFETEYLDIPWKGAFGMWAILSRAMDDGVPVLNPDWLSSLTIEEFSDLTQPSGNVDLPHIANRVKNLNQLGDFMLHRDIDTFQTLFEEYDVLHGGFIDDLVQCGAYQDERTYKGDTVPFNKRAQLAVTMVYDRLHYHGNQEWATFEDIDSLTLFADYGIPAYLNTVGAIEYSPELEQTIENQDEIPEDSPEEVEIRLATVQVGSILRDLLESQHGVSVGIPELDYTLWELRQEAETNEHNTLTDSY